MIGELRLFHTEPADDRLRYAGGNHVLSVLGSPAMNASVGMTTPGASMAGPAQVQNTSGGSASLGSVQLATGALLLLSLAALIALNKAGFRFSATIG